MRTFAPSKSEALYFEETIHLYSRTIPAALHAPLSERESHQDGSERTLTLTLHFLSHDRSRANQRVYDPQVLVTIS
jgi:hypothetical protein